MNHKKLVKLLKGLMPHVETYRTDHPLAVFVPQIGTALQQLSHVDDDKKKPLVEFLSCQNELSFFSQGLFNTGRGGFGISHEVLADWLIDRAHRVGPESAVADLERYLETEGNPGVQILAVAGIGVDRDIALQTGLMLVPFDSLPPSQPKAAYENRGLSAPSFIRPTAAIVCRAVVTPKTWPDSVGESSYSWEDLEWVTQLLTLVGPSAPVPVAGWWEPEQWVPFSNPKACAWSHSDIECSPTATTTFDASLRQRAVDTARVFIGLNDQVRRCLTIPVQRLNQSLRRRSLADRAIDLIISLEALMMTDKEPSELTVQLRLRAARLLGNDQPTRKSISEDLGLLYKCRSVAVHEGCLRESLKSRKTLDILARGTAIACELIWHFAEHGVPDWDRVLLG